MKLRLIAIATIAAALSATAAHHAAAQEKILYSFLDNGMDAAVPEGGLVFDSAGNLYGVTVSGGMNNAGTVYELSPPSTAGGKWTEKVIFEFESGMSATGNGPIGSLLIDGKGNLYGVTSTGNGVAYELSPPASAGGAWTQSILHAFGGAGDGISPQAGMIFDSKGNLYGTTENGGTSGGIVFELSPAAGGVWNESILFNFDQNSATGWRPLTGLAIDTAGNLYGTTFDGYNSTPGDGLGVVFELSPPVTSGGAWTETVLHVFGTSLYDGSQPFGNLIMDALGNLYGTAETGGFSGTAEDNGVAFQLSPPASAGGAWTETLLHSFPQSATDGNAPESALIFDGNGNLYGSAYFGGPAASDSTTVGAIYELISTDGGAPGATWSENVQYFFGASASDGFHPWQNMIFDKKGKLYGVTDAGGNGVGTVFEFTPVTPAAATPTFSPAAGSYTSIQSVTISDATPGATIYYTTNGDTPSTASTKYTAAISVSATETIKAIAAAPNYVNSAVASVTYTLQLPAATPVCSPVSGTYSSAQSVTISDATPSSTIYYTTDGTTPTTSSPKYTGAFTVSKTTTVFAIATAPGFSTSAVGDGFYTIVLPAATPVFSPKAGTYTSTQSVTIAESTAGALIYYTTDGTTPIPSFKERYSGAITVSATETIKAIATGGGFGTSAVASATYTISAATAATPVISPAAGTYATAKTVTITDATAGATIYYTTTGAAPTIKSTKFTAPFKLAASATVEAIAVAKGSLQSAAATAKYVIETPAAAPTFSPTAGTYISAQSVKLASATAGAIIYYTTNGTTPTTKSTKYTKPIVVSTDDTIKTIAVATGYLDSAVADAAYVINPDAGIISTIAGTGKAGKTGAGGPALKAELNLPLNLIFDSKGNLYFSDYANDIVQKITPAGVISTFAGNGVHGYSGDGGPAIKAEMKHPQGLAFDKAGDLYIADGGGCRIRKVTSAGIISTVAGNGTAGFKGDGGKATSAELNFPGAVAFDSTGNLYIADYGNNRIRKVTTAGIISTVAGNGTAGYKGNNGKAVDAELNAPQGVAVDATNHILIADLNNNVIRKVNPAGIISTVAGTGKAGFSGDGGAATSAELNGPNSVSIDAAGALYIADFNNNVIRKVTALGVITTVAGNGILGFSGDGAAAPNAKLNGPGEARVDSEGNLYIADSGNNRIRKVTYPNTATPKFSLAGGTYKAAQTITLKSATLGAAIYYTTNGATPTSASTKFNIDIKVSATETIKAIAIAPGYDPSAVASATYTIQ
jgi:uncharacterized repeat protein (TIGR03803 family)